jgi:hypothetical protein
MENNGGTISLKPIMFMVNLQNLSCPLTMMAKAFIGKRRNLFGRLSVEPCFRLLFEFV